MRKTGYAEEIVRGIVDLGGGHELRIERLWIKDHEQEEIRFSWWKDGKFMTRPPDGTEEEWLRAFKDALREGVFTEKFLLELVRAIMTHR